ncbi:MAG TPA: tRNA (uridine(34)/cytosine(34)/5-carboxymethylaminomethyluridine(34)-2'-O)-methyltransferase TrmL [Acidiferrobacter sp.]|nr:tRNA (uridine(34)/cytosine(34)/5-carboxymethylaminomethyluridine(34)-2'-O)-methyltransferase TrmL [Acidiferrobacter sp.]
MSDSGVRLDVVLFEPEIPPNTGNIIRLCANTGAALHLIEPLGFILEDRLLRRAGLDYHEWVTLSVHPNLEAFVSRVRPQRILAFSTHATRRYSDVSYQDGDALLFGPESRGLPADLLLSLPPEQRLRLPMQPGNRSINLSNAVAVTVYEAWRQRGFAGGD